ncbi:MAG TPA: hypothetical protein VHW01_18495 [Polyangiaceae bacterium]|jgi:hypothetical protein|nr:hypothetical protein [Polyangiaceae bacterium]
MFLSTSREALARLLAAGVLFFAPALAAADAKQCVQQNDSRSARDPVLPP